MTVSSSWLGDEAAQEQGSIESGGKIESGEKIESGSGTHTHKEEHSKRGWLDTRGEAHALVRGEDGREDMIARPGGYITDYSIHSLKAAQRAREIPRGVNPWRARVRCEWVDREGEGAEYGAGIEAEDGERAESARNTEARGAGGGRALEERRGRRGRSASEMERTGGWALRWARADHDARSKGEERRGGRELTSEAYECNPSVSAATRCVCTSNVSGKKARSIGGSEREDLDGHVRTAEGKQRLGSNETAETAELRAEAGQHRRRLVGHRVQQQSKERAASHVRHARVR
ncbi:hypothetical protein DFH09DRAFT_1295858 [Mycena vulgaris]|nr:hypothetical protein DFH09DRAFT_1295858 [Mycena vulgaris]